MNTSRGLRSATGELFRQMLPSRALRWGAYWLLWTVIAILSAVHWWYFPQGNYPYSWWELIVAKCSVWYLWGALVPIIFLLAARFHLESSGRWRNLVMLIISGVALTLLYLVGYTVAVLAMIEFPGPYHFRAMWDFIITMHSTWFFLAFWVVVGFEHSVAYYGRLVDRERLAEQLKTQLAEAQLERIKGQLQPHFLFNTLNTISSMVLSDRQSLAYDTLADLAQLLRLSLDRSEAQFLRLRDELEFTQLYVNLMSRRFPDALDVQWRIDAATLDAIVPSMVLQPLVENAVKYGMSGGAGWVKVRALRSGDWLHIVVENHVGDEAPAEPERSGRGLAFLRERFGHLYEVDRELVQVDDHDEHFTVQLTIPWRLSERATANDAKSRRQNPRHSR